MPILEKIALGAGMYFVASFFAAMGVGRFLRIASRETFDVNSSSLGQSSESLINLSKALGTAPAFPNTPLIAQRPEVAAVVEETVSHGH